MFQRLSWKRSGRAIVALTALSIGTAAVVEIVTSQTSGGSEPSVKSLDGWFTAHELTPGTKRIAESITSAFENGTPELQYGYAEELDDGRGITAGRAGFTSATGDLVLVVRRYVTLVPASPLARYLPVLEALDVDGSDDTSGLAGFVPVWEQAAADPIMRTVQDGVVDELYYRPAMDHAARIGAVLPLTLASLYDTIIQHGDGDDPDGIGAMITEANTLAGGAAADGVNETVWLRTFLSVRHQHLLHAFDPDTREAWAESAGRAEALIDLADQDEWALEAPVKLHAFGDTYVLA